MKIEFRPLPEDAEIRHAIGRFYQNTDGSFYTLAQVGENLVCLIGLYDGNRWHDPQRVNAPYAIQRHEFDRITDGQAALFTPLNARFLIKE